MLVPAFSLLPIFVQWFGRFQSCAFFFWLWSRTLFDLPAHLVVSLVISCAVSVEMS
jgi:hypothetical protein